MNVFNDDAIYRRFVELPFLSQQQTTEYLLLSCNKQNKNKQKHNIHCSLRLQNLAWQQEQF